MGDRDIDTPCGQEYSKVGDSVGIELFQGVACKIAMHQAWMDGVEAAAHLCDLMAGEGFNNSKNYHAVADRIRELKNRKVIL